MSNKGYNLESEIENFFLMLTGKKRNDPIILKDGSFGRSFRIPNSGAMKSLKGDVIGILPWIKKFFKVECKHRYECTKKKGQYICILKEWIDKNNEEAKIDNQIPILCIAFKREKISKTWFIVEFDFFDNVRSYLNFFPSSINIENCVSVGKSSKCPCIYLYKNKLLKIIDGKKNWDIGHFNVWDRRFFAIPKTVMYKMLWRLLVDKNVPEGVYVKEGEKLSLKIYHEKKRTL